MGVPGGLLLSTAVFAAFSSAMPDRAFLAWGWRVPFLISALLVGVGLFVRLTVLESPSFEKLKDDGRESRQPLVDVFREHPRELLIGMGMRFAQNVVFYIYTVFMLTYGAKSLGYPRGVMVRGVMIVSSIGLVTVPLWSHLSDMYRRKPVYLGLAIFSIA